MAEKKLKMKIKNWIATNQEKQSELPSPAISSFYPIVIEKNNKKETDIFTFSSKDELQISFNISLYGIKESEPIWVQLKIKDLNGHGNEPSIHGILNNIKLNPKLKISKTKYLESFELKVSGIIPQEGAYEADLFIRNKRNQTTDKSKTFFYLRREKNEEKAED